MTQYLCTQCDFIGRPRKELRGSMAIELPLWLLAILPGVVYAIWRYRGPTYLCPRCGAHVEPVESPEAQAILASRPGVPLQGLSRLERAAFFVKVLPLVGAGLFGVALIASLAFPSVRDQAWLKWCVYAAAIAIFGHPLWLVLHLGLQAATRARKP